MCAKLSVYGFFIRPTPLIINILSRQTFNVVSCLGLYFFYFAKRYKLSGTMGITRLKDKKMLLSLREQLVRLLMIHSTLVVIIKVYLVCTIVTMFGFTVLLPIQMAAI